VPPYLQSAVTECGALLTVSRARLTVYRALMTLLIACGALLNVYRA